jgi:hypothetical protein
MNSIEKEPCNKCKHFDFEPNAQHWCDYKSTCIHSPEFESDYFEPKQWEPKHIIDVTATKGNLETLEPPVVRLNTFCSTGEQAEDLSKRLKQLAKLHAWACEHDYLASDDLEEWATVYWSDMYNEWGVDIAEDVTEITALKLTKEGAIKTAEALNNGILIL